jgi:methyltransferase (TIGR00027 family)
MRDSEGSRTAERVAERRAAHQLLDVPKILNDPLALSIIRPEIAAQLRADPRAFDSSPLSRYLRAFLVVRSRVAEDQLSLAIAAGVAQYVLLGAGFDTFAYRSPYPASQLTIFEVDHPATQEVKKTRLAQAAIAIPPNLHFVPVDFTKDSLELALHASGFDRDRPAMVAWLGVVPYLTLDEITSTLRFVAAFAPGTTLVFDYGVPPSSLNWIGRKIYDNVAQRVAAAGEPWKTFFLPQDLTDLLRKAGFDAISDFGSNELTERYLTGRSDDLKLGPSGRIVVARVLEKTRAM